LVSKVQGFSEDQTPPSSLINYVEVN